MITRIRHTGIYVYNKDLRDTVDFYIKLGFEVFYRATENWENSFGVLTVIKLRTSSGEVLELVGQDKEVDDRKSSHLCLQVLDLDEAYKEIGKMRFFVHPKLSDDGKVKVAFCYDPNGFILELVEEL